MPLNLYIKPWCPWCVDAVAWLQSHGYTFRSLDVLTDDAAYRRMNQISGQWLTPTLETDSGDVLPDFDVGQLERFLAKHNIRPE